MKRIETYTTCSEISKSEKNLTICFFNGSKINIGTDDANEFEGWVVALNATIEKTVTAHFACSLPVVQLTSTDVDVHRDTMVKQMKVWSDAEEADQAIIGLDMKSKLTDPISCGYYMYLGLQVLAVSLLVSLLDAI